MKTTMSVPVQVPANSGSGSGSVQRLGGLQTYLNGPPNSNLAILLVSDILGYEAPNLRKLADKVAAAGFLVAVPDFFYGEAFVLGKPNFEQELAAWLPLHNTDKGYGDVKAVIAALKSKGVSAIGAAGFCWGGKVVVKLARSEDIDAAVLLHPSWINSDDINEVKVPTAILGAENDHVSSAQLLQRFGEMLSQKPQLDSYAKIYAGVGHGWTVIYNDDDESAVNSAEEAHHDMISWFVKYVK